MSVDNKESLSEALKLHQSGNWDLAGISYKQILSKEFYHPQANYLFGILLSQQKEYSKSTIYLERALPYLTDNADLFNALSINYQKNDQLDAAHEFIDSAIDINPNSPHFHHRKAKIFIDQKQFIDSINQASIAISIDKNFIPAYLTVSHCYQLLQRPNRSINFLFNSLTSVTAGQQKILFNLVDLYIEVMKFDKAQSIIDILRKTGSFRTECFAWQAMIEGEHNQPTSVIENLQASLSADPNNIIANWNLSLMHLKNKSFQAGWKLYDLGFLVKQRFTSSHKNISAWRGEPLEGKDILIINEQGIGDEIMFSLFYDEIYTSSALCTIICEPRLTELLETSFPDAEFCSRDMPLNKNQTYDFVITAGSIAQYFNSDMTEKKVSLHLPNNYTPPSKIKKNDKLLNIGFSWKGGTEYKERIRRSSHIRDWKDIFHTSNCHFWCLQPSMTEQDRKFLNKYSNSNISYLDIDDLNNDLNFVASVIHELDLIISVDNSVTHLSGALGKETLCLLPFSADWRWAFDDTKSYWYEDVTLFRQKNPGDWKSIFDQIQQYLSEKISLYS